MGVETGTDTMLILACICVRVTIRVLQSQGESHPLPDVYDSFEDPEPADMLGNVKEWMSLIDRDYGYTTKLLLARGGANFLFPPIFILALSISDTDRLHHTDEKKPSSLRLTARVNITLDGKWGSQRIFVSIRKLP